MERHAYREEHLLNRHPRRDDRPWHHQPSEFDVTLCIFSLFHDWLFFPFSSRVGFGTRVLSMCRDSLGLSAFLARISWECSKFIAIVYKQQSIGEIKIKRKRETSAIVGVDIHSVDTYFVHICLCFLYRTNARVHNCIFQFLWMAPFRPSNAKSDALSHP